MGRVQVITCCLFCFLSRSHPFSTSVCCQCKIAECLLLQITDWAHSSKVGFKDSCQWRWSALHSLLWLAENTPAKIWARAGNHTVLSFRFHISLTFCWRNRQIHKSLPLPFLFCNSKDTLSLNFVGKDKTFLAGLPGSIEHLFSNTMIEKYEYRYN